MVPDTRQDLRFKNNPFVIGHPNVSFFASAPLVVAGARIGSLCIGDTRPRSGLSAADRQNLIDVAHAIAALMASRRDTRQRTRQQAAIGRAEGRSHPLLPLVNNSHFIKDITAPVHSSSAFDLSYAKSLAAHDVSVTDYALHSLCIDLEDSLKCGICYDIICYARSLTPCMHTYCGKCISEWFGKSHPNCPSCSQKIERVHRNRVGESSLRFACVCNVLSQDVCGHACEFGWNIFVSVYAMCFYVSLERVKLINVTAQLRQWTIKWNCLWHTFPKDLEVPQS